MSYNLRSHRSMSAVSLDNTITMEVDGKGKPTEGTVTITELVENMSSKLTNMIQKLTDKVENMNDKIDRAIHDSSVALDIAEKSKKAAELSSEKVGQLEDELSIYKGKLSETEKKCCALEDKLVALENYSRRENLIIQGIPESRDENCEAKVKKIFVEKLRIADVDNMILQRVHRNKSEKKPRPMVVRFLSSKDRQKIWNAKSQLRGTNILIVEDFPKEIIARRNILLPYMQRARQLNHYAVLNGDRLFIDNRSYSVSSLNQLPPQLQLPPSATKQVGNVLGFFTGATPLSNFYKCEFEVDGKPFNCVEQYFQYCKALFAEKPDKAQEILNATSPSKCKFIGDSLEVDPDKWLPEAKKAMRAGCIAKFNKDAHAKKTLMDTGNLVLAEASKDTTWGIGKKLTDKDISKDWTGRNNLGIILESIRDTFRTTEI